MKTPLTLLKESLALYRAHPWTFFGYAAWLLLPFAAIILTEFIPNEAAQAGLVVTAIIAAIWLSIWVSIILLMYSDNIANKKLVNLQDLQREAIPKMWPLILVGLLVALLTMGGLILLIIPGIIFMVWYSLAELIVVFEDKRGMAALSASRELFRGRCWKALWTVFGGPFIIGLVYAVVYGVLFYLIATLTGVGMEAMFTETGFESEFLWVTVLDAIIEILVFPWIVIYTVLAYREMKKSHKPKTLEKAK